MVKYPLLREKYRLEKTIGRLNISTITRDSTITRYTITRGDCICWRMSFMNGPNVLLCQTELSADAYLSPDVTDKDPNKSG